eukprot:1441472-Ditylum_brightwellii.AAC.1
MATIHWTASTDNIAVKGYRVYRDGNKIAEIPPGTSYTDREVVATSTYRYSVKAFDAAWNESEVSDSVQVTIPDETSPSQPTNLWVSSASEVEATITWTPSSDNVGTIGYRVYRDNELIDTVTGTSYRDTGLTHSTMYTYFIEAFDAAGNVSGRNENFRITTKDETSPSKPSNLKT